jgi:MFS family permease
LNALASFEIPYFFRPLGGVIFPHIGDRLERKKSLFLTLAIMGSSAVLFGILPVLIVLAHGHLFCLFSLRIIYGIAVGGEWGGAVLLAVEYSEKKKRGLPEAFQ